MRKRMDQLLKDFDCSSSFVFSTKNQVTYDYFHKSAEKFPSSSKRKYLMMKGKLKQPKELSINKVGYALHELDLVFKFSCSERFSSLLLSLGYKSQVII
ncbi:Phytanoyl-CoA dioxygenase [Linum perenne]